MDDLEWNVLALRREVFGRDDPPFPSSWQAAATWIEETEASEREKLGTGRGSPEVKDLIRRLTELTACRVHLETPALAYLGGNLGTGEPVLRSAAALLGGTLHLLLRGTARRRGGDLDPIYGVEALAAEADCSQAEAVGWVLCGRRPEPP